VKMCFLSAQGTDKGERQYFGVRIVMLVSVMAVLRGNTLS